MSWIIWLIVLMLLILAIYTFVKIREFKFIGVLLVLLAIVFTLAGFDVHFTNNPKNSYECIVIEKYIQNHRYYFIVKNSEFGYNISKSSLENYVNTNVGDTIICKGWNENYLEYK